MIFFFSAVRPAHQTVTVHRHRRPRPAAAVPAALVAAAAVRHQVIAHPVTQTMESIKKQNELTTVIKPKLRNVRPKNDEPNANHRLHQARIS